MAGGQWPEKSDGENASRIDVGAGLVPARDRTDETGRSEASEAPGRWSSCPAEPLEGRWRLTNDEIVAFRMVSRDGVPYNLEQRLEHAILRLLRRRRQIDRFLAR